MAHIIDLNDYQKQGQNSSEKTLDASEDLGTAIQTLIQQLRKAPLQQMR
ncbi:MAG TPA: hypothetical protein VLI69_08510 [Gammaproteobacteria bacterium]|nr:hypothetical protein [Gammaproteobacteria bacterium]